MKYLILILLLLISFSTSNAQVADAGPDRTILIYETLILDGTNSSGYHTGFQTDGNHSIRWSLGNGWTDKGKLLAPVSYTKTGTYNVMLTVCNVAGACDDDITVVTVNAITLGTETIVSHTGNNITSGSNLKTAITNAIAQNNPVITIDAGQIYDFDGTLYNLPNRTGSGYCIIRTSQHASLPDSDDRIFPADIANLTTITPGDSVLNSAENSLEAAFAAPRGATPGHHYIFIGIQFAKKFPTLNYTNPSGFVDLGAGSGTTTLANLPHHIIFNQCYFDGGNTTAQTTRGIAIRGNDISIVNSYFHRMQLTGADVQGIWVGFGDRIGVTNNFVSATTENMMSGGADVPIIIEEGTAQATGNDSTHIKLAASASAVDDFYTGKGIYITTGTGACCVTPQPGTGGRAIIDYDGTTKIATISPAYSTIPDSTSVYRIGEYVPNGAAIRRNHFWKDPCWRSGEGCFYGINWNVKNIFEIKQWRNCTVEANIMENHWQEDQNWATVITNKNQDGRQPWATIQDLYYAHNKSINVGNGFQLLTADFFWPSLGSKNWIFTHNVVSGVGQFGGFHNFALLADGGLTISPSGMGEDVSFVLNSTDQEGTSGTGRGFMFESSTKYRNLLIYGSIFQGEITQNGPTGNAALIAATGGGAGSFTFTKNGLYRPSGTLPADNTTVTLLTDVKYTDIAAHNLLLQNDSPFLTTGPAGGRPGANITTVNTLTSGTVSGVWTDDVGSVTKCNWSSSQRCK